MLINNINKLLLEVFRQRRTRVIEFFFGETSTMTAAAAADNIFIIIDAPYYRLQQHYVSILFSHQFLLLFSIAMKIFPSPVHHRFQFFPDAFTFWR